MRSDKAMCLFDLLALGSIGSVLDIVVVRIQNLIRYMANTGFSDAKKPVRKPNRKTGFFVFFHTGTQPYSLHIMFDGAMISIQIT